MSPDLEVIYNNSEDNLSFEPITNDKIFDILFKEEDITWQSMLYELVKTNQMNPWDIDVSILSRKFIDMIKKLKEMDFRISGKVVLASAILLRMKSNQFMLEDINAFDNLIHPPEDIADSYLDDTQGYMDMAEGELNKNAYMPQLFPRTPQPRKRKVSIFDLVRALEKALEVKNRRVIHRDTTPLMEAPKHHREISLVIADTYEQIKRFFASKNSTSLTFTNLLPKNSSKDDKIMTFIPLLHLRNSHKIDLLQESHFGEIGITLGIPKTDEPIIDPQIKLPRMKRQKQEVIAG